MPQYREYVFCIDNERRRIKKLNSGLEYCTYTIHT